MLQFIIGIIFAICIIPILDGIISVVLSWFELLKTYLGVKITKLSQNINEPEIKQQLGFSIEEDIDNDI